MKSSGGVARLRDVTDWRPPRIQSGCIVLSNPKTGTPTVAISASREVPRQAPALPLRSGAITSAGFGPWRPPQPQGGLIREGEWIDLSDLPTSSIPPEEPADALAAEPKRRARKR